MDMIKIGIIGIVGVLFAAVCLIILEYIMRYFMHILMGMDQIRGYLNENYQYLSLLLKAVGATYACEFCAGICKDAGYSGVAGQVEMLGKLYILSVGMPVLLALMENIQAIAK